MKRATQLLATSLVAILGLTAPAFAQRQDNRDHERDDRGDRDRDDGDRDRDDRDRDRDRDRGLEVLIDSTLTLDFDDMVFTGENVLRLKEEMIAQHDLSPRNLKIKKIKLIAKSENGLGTAVLRIGSLDSVSKIIEGTPLEFPGDDDYDSVSIENPNRRNGSEGAWQILLSGNIKVEKVKLTFDLEERDIKVDMLGKRYTGSSILPLKRILEDEGVNVQAFVLKSVKIKAKSADGLGRARLKVNDEVSDSEKIKGNPLDFNVDLPRTYNSVDFDNPQGDLVTGGGVWQLVMQGDIKISKIEIELVKKFDREGGGSRRD
ncbi:MAG: hypothetical protein AB7T49_00950 [Oligoflexales bacterium]